MRKIRCQIQLMQNQEDKDKRKKSMKQNYKFVVWSDNRQCLAQAPIGYLRHITIHSHNLLHVRPTSQPQQLSLWTENRVHVKQDKITKPLSHEQHCNGKATLKVALKSATYNNAHQTGDNNHQHIPKFLDSWPPPSEFDAMTTVAIATKYLRRGWITSWEDCSSRLWMKTERRPSIMSGSWCCCFALRGCAPTLRSIDSRWLEIVVWLPVKQLNQNIPANIEYSPIHFLSK